VIDPTEYEGAPGGREPRWVQRAGVGPEHLPRRDGLRAVWADVRRLGLLEAIVREGALADPDPVRHGRASVNGADGRIEELDVLGAEGGEAVAVIGIPAR
jgi:hypothetical protein